VAKGGWATCCHPSPARCLRAAPSQPGDAADLASWQGASAVHRFAIRRAGRARPTSLRPVDSSDDVATEFAASGRSRQSAPRAISAAASRRLRPARLQSGPSTAPIPGGWARSSIACSSTTRLRLDEATLRHLASACRSR
jgi:hypothetical protein